MAATGHKAAARLQGPCGSLRAGISLPPALLHCRPPPPVAGAGARGPRLGQESEAPAGWWGLCECQSGCGLPLLLQETMSTGSAMGDTPQLHAQLRWLEKTAGSALPWALSSGEGDHKRPSLPLGGPQAEWGYQTHTAGAQITSPLLPPGLPRGAW